MEILNYLSDQFIMELFQTIKAEYFIMASTLGPGALWLIKKFTGWTPWTSDDDWADRFADRIGLGKPKG